MRRLLISVLCSVAVINLFPTFADARQYNPNTGRFTRRDPIQYAETAGQTQVDLYTYVIQPQNGQPQPSSSSLSVRTEPIGYEDGINLYTYVRNNPITFGDPFGESRIDFKDTLNPFTGTACISRCECEDNYRDLIQPIPERTIRPFMKGCATWAYNVPCKTESIKFNTGTFAYHPNSCSCVAKCNVNVTYILPTGTIIEPYNYDEKFPGAFTQVCGKPKPHQTEEVASSDTGITYINRYGVPIYLSHGVPPVE